MEIDNNATERAIRGVAVGRNNWVFLAAMKAAKTAAVLRSFVASCQRAAVDPFIWFKDVLPAAPPIPLPGSLSFCRSTGHLLRLELKNFRAHRICL